MNESIIRKKLANFIQVADEKKVKVLYALLEGNIEPEFKIKIEEYNAELNSAKKEFIEGKYFSHAEMKNQIKNW